MKTNVKNIVVASGIILISCSLIMTVSFILLRIYFGYPDIIRESPETILTRLHEMRNFVPFLFYSGVGIAGLCALFASLLLAKIFAAAGDDLWGYLAKYCGFAFGLCLYAGILRWTFLFPLLAHYRVTGVYDPQTIDLAFDIVHTYVGDTVAEHVSFTFISAWLFFCSMAIFKTRIVSKWIAVAGLMLCALVFYGNLEFFGAPGAFWANREGVDLIGLWILALGINLLLIRNRPLTAPE